MSDIQPDRDITIGPFGAAIRVQSDVWYAKRLVEVMAVSEPGPRGGARKSVQVLLTLDQARDVLTELTAAIAKGADQ